MKQINPMVNNIERVSKKVRLNRTKNSEQEEQVLCTFMKLDLKENNLLEVNGRVLLLREMEKSSSGMRMKIISQYVTKNKPIDLVYSCTDLD